MGEGGEEIHILSGSCCRESRDKNSDMPSSELSQNYCKSMFFLKHNHIQNHEVFMGAQLRTSATTTTTTAGPFSDLQGLRQNHFLTLWTKKKKREIDIAHSHMDTKICSTYAAEAANGCGRLKKTE